MADERDGAPDELEERFKALVESGGASMFAATLRMQAGMLRAQGEQALGLAARFERYAEDVEAGRDDPPPPGLRVRILLEDAQQRPPGAPAPADEADERVSFVQRDGDLYVERAGSTRGLSQAMVEFLDEFDDRLRLSPHFEQAVNEAARDELPLGSRDTAFWIRDRVQQLADEQGGEVPS